MFNYPQDFKQVVDGKVTNDEVNTAIQELLAKFETMPHMYMLRKIINGVEIVAIKEMYEDDKVQHIRVSIYQDIMETRFNIEEYNQTYNKNITFEKCTNC